jgi:phosphoglycolate phosphatase
VIFDLDGTLIDSSSGVLSSLRHALAHVGIAFADLPTSVSTGPTLRDLILAAAPSLTPDQLESSIYLFKHHYDSKGYTLSPLYEGVAHLVEQLSYNEVGVFIATNKRQLPTRRIIDHHSLTPFFRGIYSIDSPEVVSPEKAGILSSLRSDFSLPASSLYIGDRHDDLVAAERSGLRYAFPRWGDQSEAHLMPPSTTFLNLPDVADPSRWP